MATRLYFSRDAYTGSDPGTLSTWDSTSSKSIKQLINTGSTDGSMLLTGYTKGIGTAIYRQYISNDLAAGIVFDGTTTYTLCQRAKESSTSANAYALMYVAIIDSAGTIKGEFSANEKDGTEFVSGTYTARSNSKTGGFTYTTADQDRLVVEYGWDQDASGSYTISMVEGYTGGTDVSDGSTSVQQGWFETSATLTYYTPPPPPVTVADWDVTAYISGVLDDWL